MGAGSSKQNVPLEPAFDFINKATGRKLGVISVGSGAGVEERKIADRGHKVITVDPLPPSDIKHGMKPMYRFVREVPRKGLSSRIMLIDWSLPNRPSEKDPDPLSTGDYDLKAIESVRPQWLVIRWASCGAAGSTSLHEFLESCGLASQEPFIGKYTGPLKGKYGVLKHWQYVKGSGGGFDGHTIDLAILKKGPARKFGTVLLNSPDM